jgi:hypothetical protein
MSCVLRMARATSPSLSSPDPSLEQHQINDHAIDQRHLRHVVSFATQAQEYISPLGYEESTGLLFLIIMPKVSSVGLISHPHRPPRRTCGTPHPHPHPSRPGTWPDPHVRLRRLPREYESLCHPSRRRNTQRQAPTARLQGPSQQHVSTTLPATKPPITIRRSNNHGINMCSHFSIRRDALYPSPTRWTSPPRNHSSSCSSVDSFSALSLAISSSTFCQSASLMLLIISSISSGL